MSSPQGCPIKKFPPIQGADYATDVPSRRSIEIPPPGDCCSGKDDLKPYTWAEASKHLAESLAEWRKRGFTLTPDDQYDRRVAKCQSNQCGQYRHFQCRFCKCLIFTKAKLPHEACPKKLWDQGS